MEIDYNNDEAKKFHQEVKGIRREFKQQTLPVGYNKVTS
jgi:hypothetical protein